MSEIRRTGSEDQCGYFGEPEPPECEDCGEPASGYVFTDPHGHNKVFLCATCLARYGEREPSDEQIMNDVGIEGGIRYERRVDKRR